jgi:hypothetical protein
LFHQARELSFVEHGDLSVVEKSQSARNDLGVVFLDQALYAGMAEDICFGLRHALLLKLGNTPSWRVLHKALNDLQIHSMTQGLQR